MKCYQHQNQQTLHCVADSNPPRGVADNTKMANWLVLFFAPIGGGIFKTCPATCAEDTGVLKKEVRYNQRQGSMQRTIFFCVYYS